MLVKEAIKERTARMYRELDPWVKVSFKIDEGKIAAEVNEEYGVYAFLLGFERSQEYPDMNPNAAFDSIREMSEAIKHEEMSLKDGEELSYLRKQVECIQAAYWHDDYSDKKAIFSFAKEILGEIRDKATYKRVYGVERSMEIGGEIMAGWKEAGLDRHFFHDDPPDEVIEAVFELFDKVFALSGLKRPVPGSPEQEYGNVAFDGRTELSDYTESKVAEGAVRYGTDLWDSGLGR